MQYCSEVVGRRCARDAPQGEDLHQNTARRKQRVNIGADARCVCQMVRCSLMLLGRTARSLAGRPARSSCRRGMRREWPRVRRSRAEEASTSPSSASIKGREALLAGRARQRKWALTTSLARNEIRAHRRPESRARTHTQSFPRPATTHTLHARADADAGQPPKDKLPQDPARARAHNFRNGAAAHPALLPAAWQVSLLLRVEGAAAQASSQQPWPRGRSVPQRPQICPAVLCARTGPRPPGCSSPSAASPSPTTHSSARTGPP